MITAADFERVLADAGGQVLDPAGKGMQRHGRGRLFGRQPTLVVLDLVGPGYAAGQAIKKVEEALGAADPARREADLLGAIAYLAFLVAWFRGQGLRD